ncbi:MAG TPA: hypothetical protein VFV98_20470 [Vicinamibacterales bacterium]|nr:hypothetical protein [Vicinamibacterales bacterium]
MTGVMAMRTFHHAAAALLIAGCALTLDAPALAGPSADQRGKLIHRTVDPTSGSVVRLYQRTASDLTLEIEARDVRFTKRFGVGSSEITIVSGKDRIAFVVAPMVLTVSSASTTVRMTPATAQSVRPRLDALIRSSPAYREGVALLKRVRVSERTPLNLLILPARAFLEGAVGDTSALVEMRQWARTVTAKPRVVRVDFQKTPGDCWELYSQEAIEAAMELEDCLNSAPWNGWPYSTTCWGIYNIRAVGAAAWWAKCVSIS